jgi:hypothetical protein
VLQSKLIAIAGALAIAAVTSSPAMADLVFFGQVVIGGAGFGNLPRALTLHNHGSSTSESRCIGPGPTAGECSGVGTSTGGDEASPIKSPKQAAPTLSSLGITDASQIAVRWRTAAKRQQPERDD